MYLGLDLKGGVHFLLQVDRENIIQNLLREIESDVKTILIENKHRYNSFSRLEDNIEVNFNSDKPINLIIEQINESLPDLSINQKSNNGITSLNIAPSVDLI